MRKLLGGVLIAALLMGVGWPVSATAAAPPLTHRYAYFPAFSALIDLDNWPSNAFKDPALAAVNVLPYYAIVYMIALDSGFTYLEGPEIPAEWLDSPPLFAAALADMTRIDVAAHTQGANMVWGNDTFTLPNGSRVASIAYAPQLSSPEDQNALRIGGGFWWAWIYAGINTGDVVADIINVTQWPAYHQPPTPSHVEFVEWRDYQPYKVLTFYSGGADDPKAFTREILLDIVQNAGSDHVFAIDARLESVVNPLCQPFPSTRPPFNCWTTLAGRFHKANLTLGDKQQPQLTNWPIRDPSTPICPNERYMWWWPQAFGFIHDRVAQDQGERCFDVDTLVEYDLSSWWNPLGFAFKEVLSPTVFNNDLARAWVFLHVAMNNGHRLIDAVNPKDSNGAQKQSIIDVPVFDPDAYPWTFEGGPKIHGYHKLQVSPTISEFYKRLHWILSAGTPQELATRQAFFRDHLADIISNVHIYVRDPADQNAKTEIAVPELFQMIADRWSADRAFTLFPFHFFWRDMPVKDYGQGKPVTFEIHCTFDTNPDLGGPWVPIQITAQAHEAAYLTTEYGDVWYMLMFRLQGGDLPPGLPNPFPFPGNN